MGEITPPLFMDVDSFYSGDELGLPYRDIVGEGCLGYEDLRVRERAAGGANMSVDIGPGSCWVMGDEQLYQPNYRCRSDSIVNKVITAAHATLPRLDQVIAEVLDSTFSGASKLWRLRVVDGVATSGATLDNRNGAAALPNNSIRLADVLVALSDSSITNAEIRDRRPMISGVPTPKTDVDLVVFEPQFAAASGWGDTNDLGQAAGLMRLPRRIVAATRIRWKYRQDASIAATGTFVLAIYDASGRKIVDTGPIALAGAVTTNQPVSAPITATTFEAGLYYGLIGMDYTAGNAIRYVGSAADPAFAIAPNVILRSATGGVTPPTTLAAMTDLNSDVTMVTPVSAPVLALSVG